MVHPNTERLTEYWRGKAGGYPAPTRAAIDPMEFVELLPQTIIVGRRDAGDLPFRLIGGLVADLHDRDLRGANLLGLWAPHNRAAIRLALEQIRRRPEPLVVTAEMIAEGVAPLGLEVLLAPLVGPSGEIDRFLGLYQPLGLTARLMRRPVTELRLKHLSRSGEEGPRLRLAALDGRQIA